MINYFYENILECAKYCNGCDEYDICKSCIGGNRGLAPSCKCLTGFYDLGDIDCYCNKNSYLFIFSH